MNTSSFTAVLASLLLAASAHAAVQAQPQTSAGSPAIGQAVSGQNTTAAGTSGTGLHTDGTATTHSKQADTGRQAAGVDRAGRVAGKSTAVINAAPGKVDNVNAQATNTTAPNDAAPDAKATGGRGQAGTRAQHEVMKANAREVKEVPGARQKNAVAAQAARKKQAKIRHKKQAH